MFFLLGGNEKKARKQESAQVDTISERVKDLFLSGKFPVVTTPTMEGKEISKVLGLVCCRGYDSEEAFFGMASRAVSKGAHAIIGYMENVAFHPDGSKYFSCFGTAVMFAYEADERFGAAALIKRSGRMAASDGYDNLSMALEERDVDRVSLDRAVTDRVRMSSAGALSGASSNTGSAYATSERKQRFADVNLGLDPDELPPHPRQATQSAQAGRARPVASSPRNEHSNLFDPSDLQEEEDVPIRKFRTQ